MYKNRNPCVYLCDNRWQLTFQFVHNQFGPILTKLSLRTEERKVNKYSISLTAAGAFCLCNINTGFLRVILHFRFPLFQPHELNLVFQWIIYCWRIYNLYIYTIYGRQNLSNSEWKREKVSHSTTGFPQSAPCFQDGGHEQPPYRIISCSRSSSSRCRRSTSSMIFLSSSLRCDRSGIGGRLGRRVDMTDECANKL